MKFQAIELTNACNLKCSYCPNSNGVKYPKGFLKLNHFLKAMDYIEKDNIGNCIGLSVCGEPLMHPDVCEYVRIARKYVGKVEIHTNGILLTEELFRKLIDNGLTKIEISVHTEDSYNSLKLAHDINDSLGNPIIVFGLVLSCNEEKVKTWAVNDSRHYPILCNPVHNWTSDKPHKANKCRFMEQDMCCMKWDGKIVACCFDFDGKSIIGDIDNFAEVKHRPSYELCTTCSPSWATYQNDNWWWK